MKGVFKWFGSAAKMKRWILIILVGVVLAAYGIAKVLVTQTLLLPDVIEIATVFVLGFVYIVLGVVFAQKRTMELLIEASDLRLEKGRKNVNVKSLIFNKKIYDEGPKIVVIGGGAGLNTVLKGLKEYTNNITAIVTVSDYGKDPKKSRKDLDLLPSEDIKDSIISLAYDEEAMGRLLNYNFTSKPRGLNFGDIYLSAMKKTYGDFSEAIYKSPNVLHMSGKVLPVTLDEMQICAELYNGMVIEDKEQIPEVVYEKVTKINRMYITPSNCTPAPGVLEVINDADAIIIGPGSLYTNVIPNLLIKNVAKTIRESKAIKIYISNIMTEPGQTDNYSISEHIQAIIDHAGEGIIDYCIYDTGEVVPEYIRKYNKKGQDLVEQDVQKCKSKGVTMVQRNLSTIVEDVIRHNPKEIAQAAIEIVCDDLKYRNRDKDTEYVMTNTRLKQEKKRKKNAKPIYKKQVNKKTTNKKDGTHLKKKSSKFNEKYQDRIKSIQTSEEQTLKNRKKQKK